jgi:hypothetical protein
MSSPVQGPVQGSTDDSFPEQVHGDADEQSAVSESQHEAETRRLQREVVEAARRLEREAIERAPLTGFQLQDNTISFRIPVVRRAVERPSQEETNERVWSALRTEFLPPPQQGWGIPGVAVIVGSIGAVTIAAAVALLVVNLIQVPAPSVTASGEDEAAKKEFSSTAINLAKIAAAQAKMQPVEDEPQVPVSAPAANPVQLATAAPANDIATAKPAALPSPSSEIRPSPSPETKPAAIEPPAPPATASAPPAAASSPSAQSSPPPAAPESQPAVTLSQDEIASLLKRGRELIAAGDIASARLVLTHLADAGVAEASFVLAGTFDPTVLESLRIVGMRPDPAKARIWYSRAAEQGSVEARQRLQALR